MPAEDWFRDWLLDHQRLIPYGPGGWVPADDSWHYAAWVELFDALAITPEEAVAASRKLQVDRPRYPDRHPDAIRQAVLEARGAASPAGVLSDIDSARLASKDCPDCLGSGGAPRYVHADIFGTILTAGGVPAPVGSHFVVPCNCPMGHAFARGLQKPHQATPPPTVDVSSSLARRPVLWPPGTPDGLDNRYRYPPDRWDEAAGRPVEDTPPIRSPAELRTFCGSLADAYRPARRSAVAPDIRAAPDDPVIARELAPADSPKMATPADPFEPGSFEFV